MAVALSEPAAGTGGCRGRLARRASTGDEARHAVTVARMRVGERIAIGDGSGFVVWGAVVAAIAAELAIEVDEVRHEPAPEPPTLARAGAGEGRPRRAGGAGGDRAGGERASSRGPPSASSRAGRAPRRRRAASAGRRSCARRASSRSGRGFRMSRLSPRPRSLTALPGRVLVLDPTAPTRAHRAAPSTSDRITLVVGPEGGISPRELDALEQAGADRVRLGAEVLRTSTAGPGGARRAQRAARPLVIDDSRGPRPPGPVEVPDLVRAFAAGARLDAGVAQRARRSDLPRSATRYLKWNPLGSGVDLDDERARLLWAAPLHPVPRGSRLRARRPRSGAGHARRSHGPSAVTDALARLGRATRCAPSREGLRVLHDAARRRTARSTAAAGACADGARRRSTAGGLPRRRRARRTPSSAPTGEWSAHVDLGRLGVGDRWADLAVASMSLDWNFGEGRQDAFFEAYGIEPRSRSASDYYQALWNARDLKIDVMSSESAHRSSSASSRARSRPTSCSRDDRIIAFRDIAPKAPVHLLVVPEDRAVPRTSPSSPPATRSCSPRSSPSPQTLADEHTGRRVPARSSTPATAAGQTVFHVHAHVLRRRA